MTPTSKHAVLARIEVSEEGVKLAASQLEDIGLVLVSRLAVFRDFYGRRDEPPQ